MGINRPKQWIGCWWISSRHSKPNMTSNRLGTLWQQWLSDLSTAVQEFRGKQMTPRKL